MHAVQEGAASRSYGLQVAALAGVPRNVIQRARQKLHELEQQGPAQPQCEPRLSSPVAPIESEAMQALRTLDPDALTPRQALEALYRLQQLL